MAERPREEKNETAVCVYTIPDGRQYKDRLVIHIDTPNGPYISVHSNGTVEGLRIRNEPGTYEVRSSGSLFGGNATAAVGNGDLEIIVFSGKRSHTE